MGSAFEGQGVLIAGAHALSAVDALVVADMADIHLAAAHAGAAAVAAVLIYFDADEGQLVEEAVDRAEGTDEAAEGPVAEDAGSSDDDHDHEFAREEDPEHREVARVFGVGEEADGALKSARRTDVFAKARHCQVVTDPVPHGDRDDENRKNHIFEIGERARHAALFDLGSRDLVQEFLDQAQGAQPSADRSAEGQPEDHDNAQHIPSGAVSGIGERVLDRAQRAGSGGAGAGVAVKTGDADGFCLPLIDLSVDKAAKVGIVEESAV